MTSQSECTCIICDIEDSLLAEIQQSTHARYYSGFATGNAILSGFPTILSLLARLRESLPSERTYDFGDDIFKELLRWGDEAEQQTRQNILLLMFVPALHKLSRQIGMTFPALSRDDIAQHLFADLLSILRSNTLQKQRSHLAFIISRLLRRYSFRWAFRENRFLSIKDRDVVGDAEGALIQTEFETNVHLHEFLSRCLKKGRLEQGEYESLIAFKVYGVGAEVLAARSGVSEIAFRHRMQRLVDRLRRITQETPAESAPRILTQMAKVSRRSVDSAA